MMIIVISNRSLNLKEPIGNKPENHSVKVLGKDLNASGNVVGLLKYNRSTKKETIDLYPKGQEAVLFADTVTKLNKTEEMKRPWVMFVHGFNQTIEKNLVKARNLEERRNVNVIVFSWPSQPEPGNTDKAMQAIKKKFIKKLVKTNTASFALGYITDFIEDYWKTYSLAKVNAEKSADDLIAAFKMVQTKFIARLPKKIPISLLTHSLGHYLLENTVVKHGGLKSKFTHVILHQADCASHKQKQWIPNITKNADHVYITANKYDSVLAASFIHNQTERLGHSQQGYIKNKKISYCDFTGIPTSSDDLEDTGECMNENSHGIFNLPLSQCADDMYNLLSRLITSQKVGLPTEILKIKNGFMKTRQKINLFQPEVIVDDFGDLDTPL